jgi:hypothetical protein
MADGVGLNVRKCYWNEQEKEYPTDTFCAGIPRFAADGTLTQHKTQLPHTAGPLW